MYSVYPLYTAVLHGSLLAVLMCFIAFCHDLINEYSFSSFLLKRLNLGSRKQRRTMARVSIVFDAKNLGEIPTGSQRGRQIEVG